MEEIKFFVPGDPKPGGSKTSFMHPKTKKIVTIDACKKNKNWRAVCALFANEYRPEKPFDTTIEMIVMFVVKRPKYHFYTGKRKNILRPNAPKFVGKKPDGIKLTRAFEDALTGIIYKDDALIARHTITKMYGDNPGVHVTIKPIE